ncbi:hypothetical protein DAPPUDRAFT_316351 [Daphnia pulex]|uniref:Ionotropic glutamate receptor C-terminal domain-containing protein n=1 Tax=Daphnia pulex TaxID=6669 RepID=E9GCM2_DAPPU|nr:hypothetical protein DAPPUDRAFT_316351 [Daphnia pulex]|eukprot:EFX82841.1 hypothetical protein DAPPUDRAFT_316351 [Daphnia pulex]
MNLKNMFSFVIRYFVLLCVTEFLFIGHFKANADVYSLKSKLENKHLLLSATKSPLVKDKELTTVSLGILEEIILEILSSHMKFTYTIVPPSDILSPGYLRPNGSWTGTTGQLQRREVDMCVTTSAPSSAKLLVSDISYPVLFVDAAILIPFPKEKTKWVDASAFQSQAWLAIGCFFAFMILSAWIPHGHRLTKSHPDMECQNSLSFWIFYYFCIWMLIQGATLRNRSTPLRLVCLVSFFGSFIIMNYFTASYTSILSIPNFKATVGSIEDLANNGAVNPLLIKGSSTEEYIMSSSDATMKKISERMRYHPERSIRNALTVDDVSTIVKENSALVLIKSTGESLIDQSYKINKECRVTLAEKTFFSRPQTFTYPKNSSITKSVNYNLLLMQQAGLIQYAERRSAVPYNRCSVSEATKIAANKVVPLKLKDVAGAFVILALGSALSFVVLFVECILKKTK